MANKLTEWLVVNVSVVGQRPYQFLALWIGLPPAVKGGLPVIIWVNDHVSSELLLLAGPADSFGVPNVVLVSVAIVLDVIS